MPGRSPKTSPSICLPFNFKLQPRFEPKGYVRAHKLQSCFIFMSGKKEEEKKGQGRGFARDGKRVDARGKRHGRHSEQHAATIAFFHSLPPPPSCTPATLPHARSQRRPSLNLLQRPTIRRIRSDLRGRYRHLLDTKRSGQGTCARVPSTFSRSSDRLREGLYDAKWPSADHSIYFRRLRFGGWFSLDYLCTMLIGFSTATWTGEG